MSSKWRWQSSKNLNFIVGNPEAAWGVCFKAARGLGLGIFCGVWRSKIYLEVRSPQITKTPAEKGDAGERALGNPSQAVYWSTQVRYGYASLPPLIASPPNTLTNTPPPPAHTQKSIFCQCTQFQVGMGKPLPGYFMIFWLPITIFLHLPSCKFICWDNYLHKFYTTYTIG